MQPDYAKSSQPVSSFLHLAANGNVEAGEFLELWHRYNHDVDDVIDELRWNSESLLSVLMMACTVFSHPFYRQHFGRLQSPVILATNLYMDSVKWEKDPALWKRQWAEVTRHAGNEVIYTVAMITGGWDHLRKMSAALMAACYVYRADKYGVPT